MQLDELSMQADEQLEFSEEDVDVRILVVGDRKDFSGYSIFIFHF